MADKIYVERAPGYRPTGLDMPAAMAKMKVPEVAVRAYEEMLKWLGAYGCVKEGNVFRG
ncbi:hypothetical protein B6U99_05700 [Candidatus Geothermarchaeota archaeon ex4572_27]|nr:MAG: hypothetical protein B6U99_05700 [Candidatus Geothermarchaeota archaeon ex4572_27]